MKKYSINLWIAILCLMCVQQVQAQNDISIRGQVVDGVQANQ